MSSRYLFHNEKIVHEHETFPINAYGSRSGYDGCTSGIGMSLDGPTATLTVGGESYRVSDLRYMYFTNSETPENVVVIPSIGWATFCSASALDFSGTDGLTAYKATFGTATVSLSAISSATRF